MPEVKSFSLAPNVDSNSTVESIAPRMLGFMPSQNDLVGSMRDAFKSMEGKPFCMEPIQLSEEEIAEMQRQMVEFQKLMEEAKNDPEKQAQLFAILGIDPSQVVRETTPKVIDSTIRRRSRFAMVGGKMIDRSKK